MEKTSYSNIPISIENKLQYKLHNKDGHPINIMKKHIYKFFETLKDYNFEFFDDLDSIVKIEDNFDRLLIPKDHPARGKTDTYYVNENYVLRTHTSAHQNELLEKGCQSFIVTGDVYRKDEIDSHHYPIFHQMEIFTLVDDGKDPIIELKNILSKLVEYLFTECEYRFNDDYFPFTHPSFEIEVKYMEKWLEILGCGVVQPKILENNGIINKRAIAAGLGLDRLVMIFTKIPDIRYIWSDSDRFLNQYKDGKLNIFIPFTNIPSISKDISFYLEKAEVTVENSNIKWEKENDFYEIARENCGDYIEEVKLIDSFYNKKIDKYSKTFRLVYSPYDATLNNPAIFNEFVNSMQDNFRSVVISRLNIIMR